MDMQDKEFDDLFRSKLDGFEAEPSRNVWTGIDAELSGNRRKKILMPFLSIAASIIVLVAAGILFIPEKGKVTGKHPVQNKIAKTSATLITSPIVKSQSKPVLKSEAVKLKEATLADNRTRQHYPKADKNLPVKQSPLPGKAVETGEQAELAATPRTQPEVIDAVAPDISTQIAVKQPVVETITFKTKPPVPSVEMPAGDKRDEIAAKPTKKLRSLGDIINAAVAKVDKRKDKIIEFSDTDDNGSTITAVNLGIIKIKKRE
jgi:hypothetical protein